jgi:hypothetical protein
MQDGKKQKKSAGTKVRVGGGTAIRSAGVPPALRLLLVTLLRGFAVAAITPCYLLVAGLYPDFAPRFKASIPSSMLSRGVVL